MRREWIEMYSLHGYSLDRSGSPSMRREWIEILWHHGNVPHRSGVSLHAEGVD